MIAAAALSSCDLRQLRNFLAVVEHGGVSAAAYGLGASLSTISRDLSSLEHRLGIRLCRRGRSGFALTPHGEEVHNAAVRLFSELQSFNQTVQSTRQTLRGGFNFGAMDNVVTNPGAGIVEALAKMHRAFPDMLINVSVHSDPMIDVQVRDRHLDLGVTGQPEWLAPLEYEPSFLEEHRLYISRGSPHLAQARQALAAADGSAGTIPYISRGYRVDVFQKFEQRFPMQIVARGSMLESVFAAVLAGVGAALLPVHLVRAAVAPSLLELPTPRTPLHVQFHFVYRRDATNRRAIMALLESFRAGAGGTAA